MPRLIAIFSLAILIVVGALVTPIREAAQTQLPTPTAGQSLQTTAAAAPAEQTVTHYTLPPDKLRKAYGLYLISGVLFVVSTLYGWFIFWLFLRCRWMVRVRDWAERVASRRVLQAAIVMPIFVALFVVLTLPLGLYAQHVERVYGISVQGWGSWFRDWLVQLLLLALVSTLLGWVLYTFLRRSPRRFWLYFWLAFIPISAFLVFIEPVAIEPLFNKFEPLQPHHPELVTQLERVIARSGIEIPASRMFEMKASEKLTGSNAYVTGFGSTKRVVVWDTAIDKLTTQQIMYVFGHELGHYVLGHVVKGFFFTLGVCFVLFYLNHRLATFMQRRWGAGWGIRDLDDWASLPLLCLAGSVLLFAAGPLLNAYSRAQEHQADQYGLEIVHGMFPDSGQVAAQSFQRLGEQWLEYRDVSPAAVFFAWDHPPIRDRVQFALTYDPWGQGQSPEFVKTAAGSP
ncbi:MAG: M48 family metallopeptidase [Candidatus Sulfotelmatobacter sp.]